ncbi:MAG TPA: type II toxin-antitoxin system PemK/MazF family toxin [Chloroflexota bacterium]|nr:type II toxin-antitoxin system PemK/MazF family toxin [Chloroflexota bacterium]
MGPSRAGLGLAGQGAVVLVPFPFTDLTGRKQRPALVVSPSGIHPDDLILCAITSQVPSSLSRWELPLAATDLVEQRLPRPSVIQVAKLFTCHRSLVRGRFGTLEPAKLGEVLERLRVLFAEPSATGQGDPRRR